MREIDYVCVGHVCVVSCEGWCVCVIVRAACWRGGIKPNASERNSAPNGYASRWKDVWLTVIVPPMGQPWISAMKGIKNTELNM